MATTELVPLAANASRARATLDAYLGDLNGGKLEIREGSTVLVSITLQNPAATAATGTGGPGTRTISLAGLPLSATATASSSNNSTPLTGHLLNSSNVQMFDDLTVTTNEVGATGAIKFNITASHGALAFKPVIVASYSIEISSASFTL